MRDLSVKFVAKDAVLMDQSPYAEPSIMETLEQMNKLGKHHNLPNILRQPSSLYSCINSRVAPSDKSVPSASNHSHQPLFTEVHRENLQCATQSESSEKCDVSKKGTESNASAEIRGCRANNLSVIPEECKENSLPPVSFSLDFQHQNSVPENPINCSRNREFTQTIPASGNAYTIASLDSTIHAVGIVPPPPVNIRIQSLPTHRIVPPQPNLSVNVVQTVASVSNTEAAAVHLLSPLHVAEHKKSISDLHVASNAQSKELQDASSSERVPSVPKSRPTSPKMQGSTKTQQYQCPKCLLRFDRILAQLDHKCHPERASGGSLRNRPSLKLYKCLECCEEFSDLQEKIRHTCSAQMEIQPNGIGSVTEVKRQFERLGTNWQCTQNGTVVCNICNMELANDKHGMKLHMTNNHVENKRKERSKKMLFKCLTCCTAFPSNSQLKQHQLDKHSQKHLNVDACDNVHVHAVSEESEHRGPTYKKRFKCGLCSMNYYHSGFLKNHIALHIGSDEDKRRKLPFVCRLCEARFRWSKELKTHAKNCCLRKKHAGINQNVDGTSQSVNELSNMNCTDQQVNDSSSTITTSISKDKTRANPTPEASTCRKHLCKCGFCGITCDSDTTLRKHVRTHWNEIFEKHSNPLICSRCTEEFDDCVKLYLHVRRNSCTSDNDDTSQSDGSEGREEGEGEASKTVDKPEGSSSHGDALACHKRKDGQYHCLHCSLTFWSPQILSVHLQSSHLLLLDKEETVLPKSYKDGEESSKRNLEEVVQPTESLDPVLPSRNQTNSPDDGKRCLPSDQSPTHQDSADIEDTNVSRRTQIYPCRCNICKLDFNNWGSLKEHRLVRHPRKVRHLQLGASQQDGPDELIDDPSVEIIKKDLSHPCDLCDRVFSFWRTLALHKKAKHQVRFMFARYSSPRKQLNQEILKSPGIDQMSKSTEDPTSKRNSRSVAQASVLYTQEQQEAILVPEPVKTTNQSTYDGLICSLKLPLIQYQNQSLTPSYMLSQQPLTGVSLEIQAENVVNSDNQSVGNFIVSERTDQGYEDNINHQNMLNPSSVHKRTVEDLKISSVVSLYKGGPDSTTWQRSNSAVEIPAHPHMEKNNCQHIPNKSQNVKSREVLESPQISLQDKIRSPSPQIAKAQQDTRDAFSCLIDSVLALESSEQTNDFRTESVMGHVTAGRDALSHSQSGWHGTMKKISFREAKNILKVSERHPTSDCFHCSVCGEWFELIPHYTSHILAHCNSELYFCSFCKVKSYNIFSMLHHVINAHDLSCKPHRSTTDAFQAPFQIQNFFEAGGTINQPVHNDGPEPFILSDAPLYSVHSRVHQLRGTTYPRPLYDYIYKPIDLEIHLKFDAQKGAYMCPLCPFRNEEKEGFIYHLRMHHEHYPYRCRHCHHRFNFFPDVQVHFFKCHNHVMQADQQQAEQALENQNLSLESQFMNQIGNTSSARCQPYVAGDMQSAVLNGLMDPGQEETNSTAVQNCSGTDNVSVFPTFCVDTTMEWQHKSSNTDPDGGAFSTNLESQQISSNGETIPSFIKVKQERLTDDEVDKPSCMVKGDTLNFIKTETVSIENGITVKTENLEYIHQGAEWVKDANSEFTHFEDHSTSIYGENQQSCDSGIASVMPSVSIGSGSEPPSETPSCSDVSANPKPFDEGSCCREAKENEPSDLMRAENEITSPLVDPDYPNCPETVASHSVAAKECNENTFHYDQGDLPVDVRIKDGVTRSGVCSPCVETQVPPCRMQSIADTPSSDGKVTGNDGIDHWESQSVEDAVQGETSTIPESSGISSRTVAEKESDSLVHPLDDLFQLASDIGITVTGSNNLDVPAGEATFALEENNYWDAQSDPDTILEGTKEDNDNPNAMSVADQDENVQPFLMASNDSLSSSPTLQAYNGNDSDMLQEYASPESKNGELDVRDIETNVHIEEELVKQTSASFLRKRTYEDNANSHGTTKWQKLETSPIEAKIDIQNKPAIRITQECESPSYGEWREKDSSIISCKEASNRCVSLRAGEDQRGSSPLNSIGEDEVISKILKDVAKNCFTSRILKSFEKECTESVSFQNSLDLDLITGPPFVDLSTGTLKEAEGQQDIPLSKQRQNITAVKNGHSRNENLKLAGVNMSSMPKIFDVAGNGQMPGIPCGWEQEDCDKIPLISASQDQYSHMDAVTEDLNRRSKGTKNSRPLKGSNNPVRHAEYPVITEPRRPTGDPLPDSVFNVISPSPYHGDRSNQNPHLNALLNNTEKELYICPDETRSSKPASEIFSSPHCSDAKNGNTSIGWDVQESHQKHGRINQKKGQSFHGAKRYSCEESWISHYQESELVSPQSSCEPPTLYNQKAVCLKQQYQDFPGNLRNSSGQFQADNNQGSQLTSSQMTNLPPTYDHSCKHQQHYQDYQLRRNDCGGQSSKHSPRESSTVFFQTSKNCMAALNRVQEARAAYSHLSCHSSQQNWAFNDQQEMMSPDLSNQLDALNRGHEATYSDRNSLNGYACNNSLESNFKASEADIQEAAQCSRVQPTHNQWSAGGVPQQQNQDFYSTRSSWNGPSWNPHAQSRRPQLVKQHSVPSGNSQTESGGLYKYHRVNRPVRSQLREQLEAKQKKTYQATPPSIQRLPATDCSLRYAPNHPQGDMSQCLPQIVSVASLHPRFLNRIK